MSIAQSITIASLAATAWNVLCMFFIPLFVRYAPEKLFFWVLCCGFVLVWVAVFCLTKIAATA